MVEDSDQNRDESLTNFIQIFQGQSALGQFSGRKFIIYQSLNQVSDAGRGRIIKCPAGGLG